MIGITSRLPSLHITTSVSSSHEQFDGQWALIIAVKANIVKAHVAETRLVANIPVSCGLHGPQVKHLQYDKKKIVKSDQQITIIVKD